MRQKILLAITLTIACSFVIAKVQKESIGEPLQTKFFSYTIFAIDPKSGIANLTLEKSTAVKSKGKTSTTSTSYTISNASSLIRIKINDAVFQATLDNLNSLGGPSDYISLYMLSTGKSRSFTINTDGSTNASLIPLNFIPTETRSNTKMIPVQALIPGEYAFVDKSTLTADGNNITVWSFGIDK